MKVLSGRLKSALKKLRGNRITGGERFFDSFIELAVAYGTLMEGDARFAMAVSGRARLPVWVQVGTRLTAVALSVPLMVCQGVALTGSASALTEKGSV